MAKVILEAIGASRERILDEETWQLQLAEMQRRNASLEDKRTEVRAGWGEKYVQRVRAKGKLPTWERIERLKDADSPILPLGTLVNWGRTFGSDKRGSRQRRDVWNIKPDENARCLTVGGQCFDARKCVGAAHRDIGAHRCPRGWVG